MRATDIRKSDIGAQASWKGFTSQTLYIANRLISDNDGYEFYPEDVEDLIIRNNGAAIDGATIFQRIRYITIPSIRPTLVIMILLQVGRILRGDFEMFYQIIGLNGQLYNATDVIDTYVFRSLVTNPDIGMTSAATFYQSVLCFVIIMVVNAIVKRIDEDYALF